MWQVEREVIDVTSGQRSNRRLLLCPLVTSITSLSTCHVYCFSVHMSRLLLLSPLVTSITSREVIDVTSGERSNRRDKWTEKQYTWQVNREAIDMTSGQRSNRCDKWTEKLVTSIASLSTCHVYYFSLHLSRILLLCPHVTSITSLSTCHVYCFCPLVTSIAREAKDVTSGQRSNRRDKWREK
jgi:hypothetical protein